MPRCLQALIPIAVLIILNVLAVVPPVTAQDDAQLKVAASITPFGALVNEVGGSRVQTTVLLPEGVEPHAFTATPQIIEAAQQADLLVLTGHFTWETDVANQTDTPFITLADYEEYGAALSVFPGREDTSQKNPHGYWLLPNNAIAIANAIRAALSEMKPDGAAYWNTRFESFVDRVESLNASIAVADEDYQLDSLRAVVVFPAEAYIAEAFGMSVEAVLQEGENIFISGSKLVEVQNGLRNGTIDIILGSDVGNLQAGGQFAEQLAEDTGSKIVWWRAVFTGQADYVSLMSFDLGVLVESLRGEVSASTEGVATLVLVIISSLLGLVAVVEGVLLIQRAREE